MTPVSASYVVLANLSGVWTDITADVLGEVKGEWGMSGGKPLDLLADTGTLTFDLNNTTKKYSPSSGTALAGWKKGVEIKVVFTYDGEDYVRFRGVVEELDIDAGTLSARRAHVIAVDWLEYAARHPIVNPGVLADQTGDQVISTTLALIPQQPAATDIDTGVEVFPTTFDTTTSRTKAYDEFSKVVNSEVGYIYLRKDKVNGETLVFENSQHRHGWQVPTIIPKVSTDSTPRTLENGTTRLLESGVTRVLNESQAFEVDNSMLDIDVEYGSNLINRFTVYAVPRLLDTTPQILFSLDAPFVIEPGGVYTLKGNYVDPEGGLPINARDMIDPVITTDYLVNDQEDGGGADASGYLLITTSYGTEGFTHQLRFNGTSQGWVTKYNCRGTGIYLKNPIEHAATALDSIDEFETYSESMTQKYKNDLYSGAAFAEKIVEEEKQPRTVLTKVYMNANRSGANMMAFLNLDVGDIVPVAEDQSGIDLYHYIQGVTFRAIPGDIVFYEWIVRETKSYQLGLSQLAIEFRDFDGIGFDYVPYLSDLRQRTMSFWMYLDNLNSDGENGFIWGAGWGLYFGPNRRLLLESRTFGDVSMGYALWETSANDIPLDAWCHVVITQNTSGWPSGCTPTIYINGSSVTVNQTDTPNGTYVSEEGIGLGIGHPRTDGVVKYKDMRMYGRILTSAEVTTLYNSGTQSASLVTDGLLFQAFAVRTTELADYVDAALTEEMQVRDNMFGLVGTVNAGDAPIGRAV